MDINHSEYTIAEITDRFSTKEIRINRSYQRGGGIWPQNAKSYFIDTLLESYPFPKLYLHQIYDRARKKPILEVVDGQQRLLTIVDFVNDKFKLSKSSSNYSGLNFSSLDEETQEKFRMSRIQADVILSAERAELLEMFRRINAYTAPLNAAESRHAKFQGKFKWFAVNISDKIDPVLEEFGILTTKQLVRMADAELISNFILVLEKGLIHQSESSINELYKKYEDDFPDEEHYFELINKFFNMIKNDFSELRHSLLMKTYAVHSLFSVFAHFEVGIPNGQNDIGIVSGGQQFRTDENVIQTLLSLSDAQELKDIDGPFKEYVNAAIGTTTKYAQRRDRSRFLASILCPK